MAEKTVLIVDDNKNNSEIYKIYLESEGYTVLSAENGEQGLTLIKEILPDVILLDIMMPVMDGYQMLETLRTDSSTTDIPVLVLTVRTNTHDVVKAFQMGANDYLKKPFNVDELIARANKLLKLKQTQDSLKQKTEILQQHQRNLEYKLKKLTQAA